MSERKPPGVSWESWADRQIREGIERGEFEGLEGAGRPLDGLDGPHDELWWVKEKLRREEVQALPPTLALRKQLDDLRATMAATDDEATVRRLVEELNERIRHVNRYATAGPPSTFSPYDVDDVVRRWRERRAGQA